MFDALNPKCYSGSGTSFTELVSGYTTTAVQNGNLNIVGNHLRFTPGAATRTNYIPFPVDLFNPNNGVRVPTGSSATWSWFQYFEDQGSIDHPNIGWETGSGWDGADGFVFGTGWGTDGPRWGIGGTAYNYTSMASSARYATNVWQNYTVTFDGNLTNGVKTYLNGVLVNEQTAGTNKVISGVNTNNLHIGSTNSRGGNWGGYMDIVLMWNETLDASDVYKVYNCYKNRFGL